MSMMTDFDATIRNKSTRSYPRKDKIAMAVTGVSLEADNRRFPPATFNITAGYILYHVFKFLVFIEFKLAYFHKNYNIKYM